MTTAAVDLVCFSHLRWGFVFQRPNHLMVRFARRQRVFFVEEPVIDDSIRSATMDVEEVTGGPFVCVPRLPAGLSPPARVSLQRDLVDELFRVRRIHPRTLWFYTPMALAFAGHLRAPVVVYDCMDELSGFRGAPSELGERERALFDRVDLVFTGGHSLYRAKRGSHPHVHAFPSSVDAEHFSRARSLAEPADQARIPGPKLGFFGVIDERMDLDLIARIADERPDWHIVMIGPVVKVDPADLPQRTNIHWLGSRTYDELPGYISGWTVATMPFALNDATRFISPTKTLEYLAAGKPIVSTAIEDVVEPYGTAGIVRIAGPSEFVGALADAMEDDPVQVRAAADAWVARTSWDCTWALMNELVENVESARLHTPQERMTVCSTI